MVLPNDDVFGEFYSFFRSIFLQNIKKKAQSSAKTSSVLLNNGVTQWQRFWGTLRFFFEIFFSEISRSHTQRISQFLFQPNAHKHLFSFDVPTVAGSHSFLRKVAQCSTNLRFHQLCRTLTNINKLHCAMWLSWGKPAFTITQKELKHWNYFNLHLLIKLKKLSDV